MSRFNFRKISGVLLLFWTCTLGPGDKITGGGVETGNSTAVGQVVATGIALNEMTVTAQSDLFIGDGASRYKSTVHISDAGYYYFDSLPAGKFRVIGVDPRGEEGFTRTFVVGQYDDSVFIGVDSLRTVGHISGKITRYEGASPAGIIVALRGTSIATTVARDGVFEFTGVPPGVHVLIAQATWVNKGIPQLKTILVEPGKTANVSFFLPAEQTFKLNIFPGQVWSYRTRSAIKDSAMAYSINDSLPISSFEYYINEKDTIINGLLHYTIRQCSFNREGEKAVYPGTNYLYVGIRHDTVQMYETYGSSSAGSLFKRSSNSEPVVSSSIADSLQIVYDTSIYCDFRIPVILNILPNHSWYFRGWGDLRGSLPILQKYTGNEIVSVPGGTFNCMRMEWIWADFPISPGMGVSFISDIGNVMRVVEDTGSSSGIGYFGSKFYSEYLGTDTTAYLNAFPRLPDALWDSIWTQVASHWSIKRFREWITSVDSSNDLSMSWELSDPLYELIRVLNSEYTYNVVAFDELADTLSIMQDTLPRFSHLNPEKLVDRLLTPEYAKFYAQGWDDCDWDSKKGSLYNVKDTIAPFGRSALATSLYEKMGGYYLYVKQQR